MSFGQLLRLAGTVMLVIDFETGALGIREERCQAIKGPNGKPEILLANVVGGDDCSFDEYVGAGRRGFRDESQQLKHSQVEDGQPRTLSVQRRSKATRYIQHKIGPTQAHENKEIRFIREITKVSISLFASPRNTPSKSLHIVSYVPQPVGDTPFADPGGRYPLCPSLYAPSSRLRKGFTDRQSRPVACMLQRRNPLL